MTQRAPVQCGWGVSNTLAARRSCVGYMQQIYDPEAVLLRHRGEITPTPQLKAGGGTLKEEGESDPVRQRQNAKPYTV